MTRINLNPQIADRLIQQFGMVEVNGILRKGRCPECHKKTLWTWKETPGQVQCDRTNKCNYSITTKELFPDLFEKINQKYKPTTSNPKATADAYISLVRGFDVSKIHDWYDQGKYWSQSGDRGTATVRFWLDADRKVMWERFVEDVTITDDDGDKEVRNKNFKGSFRGHWWQPPGFEINTGDEVHWCEGIFDAIALNLNGLKAVAILSSGTFPDSSLKAHLGKNVIWVISLDNDATGRRFLQKHAQKLRNLGEQVAAMVSAEHDNKKDWNDLHQAQKLTEKDISRYRYLGGIELAESYRQKAQLIWQHRSSRHYFVFDFRNRTYSLRIDQTEFDKALRLYWSGIMTIEPDAITDEMLRRTRDSNQDKEQAGMEYAFGQASKIQEIATFKMDFLYFQKPDNGEDGQYFFRFKFSNNAPETQLPFTGKTFGSCGDFKKAAMHKAPGAQFTGSTCDLDELYRGWMSHIPKVVRTLDFIGYDAETKAYVFNDYAVESGKVLKLNTESFFQLKTSGIKTTADIRQTLATSYHDHWLPDFKTAFGIKGFVVLAWWFGCLFVEQQRQAYRSYPFLEFIGDPGSGKSDLVDFLWKLLGKEGESFNPNSSTLAGRTRKMAEVSNMPVVFNETDNEKAAEDRHQKQFNWDEQKDLYDGQFGRVTGIKSQDNTTKKPRFKSGLMIVQNIPVQASEAILTRICSLKFDLSHHSAQGKRASIRLKTMPLDQVSGFLLHSVKQANRVMDYFSRQFKKHQATLQKKEKIKLQRIVENHAKIMAFADCLASACPSIDQETLAAVHQHLISMAEQRQESLNEDHPLVQQFWEHFEYLDTMPMAEGFQPLNKSFLNHSKTDAEIAINLEHYHSRCRAFNLQTIDPRELRRFLKTSRRRKYLRSEPVRSCLENRVVRCWIFKR